MFVAVLLAAGCADDSRDEKTIRVQTEIKPATVVERRFDAYAGSWKIELEWHGHVINGAKSWSGDMVIVKAEGPDEYRGTMKLKCNNVPWVVLQDVSVKIKDGKMRIQGANVRELKVPEAGGGYGFDVFEVREEGGRWLSGDASGENEGKGQVKLAKVNDPA